MDWWRRWQLVTVVDTVLQETREKVKLLLQVADGLVEKMTVSDSCWHNVTGDEREGEAAAAGGWRTGGEDDS